MANQTNTAKKPQREPKFLLGSLFVDADVRVEPVEPAKVVVAGMTEAHIKKEYPDGFFKKAAAVARGEFSTLFKASLWFLPAALIFILVLLAAAPFFEAYVIGGGYNFMGNIGIGFGGSGDSINLAVARLYWEVYQPLLMMLAGAGIIASPFIAGLFYCAKRSYYQDCYKRITRTYFMGFAKHWWKYLITATVGILIALAMGTALCYQLQQQQLGTASAGSMAAVVLTFIFGAPLLTVPMVMMSLFTSYDLSFGGAFKDALVIIANNPFTVIITGVISAAPLLLLMAGTIIAVIVAVAMILIGFSFWALSWTAFADRGMTKCKALKAYTEKKQAVISARARKQAERTGAADHKVAANANNGGAQNGAQGGNAPKKKQPPKPYQNPKKKKKK